MKKGTWHYGIGSLNMKILLHFTFRLFSTFDKKLKISSQNARLPIQLLLKVLEKLLFLYCLFLYVAQ